ncbi:MAG TPA: AtpZ/AtpI family protein [Vicinamibacterales bacterium]|jgi:F0F1-type ATP synthase assembly protein I
MTPEDSDSDLARSTRAMQKRVEQAGSAAGAGYTLIGAILVLGGIGYAVDAWRGSSHWGLLTGLILGVVVGMYELAKTVFLKK